MTDTIREEARIFFFHSARLLLFSSFLFSSFGKIFVYDIYMGEKTFLGRHRDIPQHQ